MQKQTVDVYYVAYKLHEWLHVAIFTLIIFAPECFPVTTPAIGLW